MAVEVDVDGGVAGGERHAAASVVVDEGRRTDVVARPDLTLNSVMCIHCSSTSRWA